MPLNANRWTEETISELAGADDYSEALESLTIKAGWHDDPATGESLLIEEETIGVNQFGQLVRRDVKEFTYDVPGTPPLF